MANLYWADLKANFYELEATTSNHKFAWYRRLDTNESVRLPVRQMRPIRDSEILAMAKEELT